MKTVIVIEREEIEQIIEEHLSKSCKKFTWSSREGCGCDLQYLELSIEMYEQVMLERNMTICAECNENWTESETRVYRVKMCPACGGHTEGRDPDVCCRGCTPCETCGNWIRYDAPEPVFCDKCLSCMECCECKEEELEGDV